MGAEGRSLLCSLLNMLLGRIWDLWAWASRALTVFRFAVTSVITEGDPQYEWVISFMHLTQGRICTHSTSSCLCATSSLRKWTVSSIPASLKHRSNETDGQQGLNVELDAYESSEYFRWRGHWVKVAQSRKIMRDKSLYWNPRNLFLTIYSHQPNLLSEFVEDARQHCGTSVKLEPRFVAQPVAKLIGDSRPSENQEAFINNVIRDLNHPTEGPSTQRNLNNYLLDGPPGTGKTSAMHALAAALGVEEIHTLVLGDEPDVTGPDPRSKVENVDLIALPWPSQLYMYLFLVVRWIDLRYRGLF
ncbi:hypothetical protein M413DRAFT_445205 [Hebeloma cylindrosporum]|uniref:BCS1 N-terminal domain-containing protein n=1 Tax=Hebeloma cylindrosporum TaxID=76867 RepID=A0A0C3CEF8_HEBCY|nr:hypothetical protein M413DRAFT_445205 [Hebeloma cylindrosporum h7]